MMKTDTLDMPRNVSSHQRRSSTSQAPLSQQERDRCEMMDCNIKEPLNKKDAKLLAKEEKQRQKEAEKLAKEEKKLSKKIEKFEKKQRCTFTGARSRSLSLATSESISVPTLKVCGPQNTLPLEACAEDSSCLHSVHSKSSSTIPNSNLNNETRRLAPSPTGRCPQPTSPASSVYPGPVPPRRSSYSLSPSSAHDIVPESKSDTRKTHPIPKPRSRSLNNTWSHGQAPPPPAFVDKKRMQQPSAPPFSALSPPPSPGESPGTEEELSKHIWRLCESKSLLSKDPFPLRVVVKSCQMGTRDVIHQGDTLHILRVSMGDTPRTVVAHALHDTTRQEVKYFVGSIGVELLDHKKRTADDICRLIVSAQSTMENTYLPIPAHILEAAQGTPITAGSDVSIVDVTTNAVKKPVLIVFDENNKSHHIPLASVRVAPIKSIKFSKKTKPEPAPRSRRNTVTDVGSGQVDENVSASRKQRNSAPTITSYSTPSCSLKFEPVSKDNFYDEASNVPPQNPQENDVEEDLEALFYQSTTRQDAETFLNHWKVVGHFLLRNTSQLGYTYALSLYTDSGIQHFLIQERRLAGVNMYALSSGEDWFNSVTLLIKHLTKKKGILPCLLKIKLPNGVPTQPLNLYVEVED